MRDSRRGYSSVRTGMCREWQSPLYEDALGSPRIDMNFIITEFKMSGLCAI